jgi:hypothetical protein
MRTTFAAAPALYERARATFAGRAAPPVVAPLDIDPAVQRAEVEFEDRLQHLLLRAHAPMASVDLLPQLAAVLRRRPARGLAMALRWSKMEAVSRSPALRGIARRRSRRDQAPADT